MNEIKMVSAIESVNPLSEWEAKVKKRAKKFHPRELFTDETAFALADTAIKKIFENKEQAQDGFLLFIKSLYAYGNNLAVPVWFERLKEELERSKNVLPPEDFYAYLWERGTNSNSAGGQDKMIEAIVNHLAKQLTDEGKAEDVELLANPFHLEAGQTIFKTGKDYEPEPVRIDEVLVEGGGGAAICDGKDFDLAKLNGGIACGKFVSPSVSGYFGDPGAVYGEQQQVFAAKKSRVTVHTPFEDVTFDMEVLSTNAEDLKKQYGPGYVFFAPKLFRAKVKINGEEKEVGYHDMRFIQASKKIE